MPETLSINGASQGVSAPLNLIAQALASTEQNLDIWLERSDGHTLAGLVNSDHAFLVWMAPDCPEGWHSRSPAPDQQDWPQHAFRLANGQIDHFDPDFCVARDTVAQAFPEFWATGQKPPSIDWIYT